jgi:shikimate kinase
VAAQRNIILTGFMGTGKSGVGKQLAARLKRRFVDTDELIEQGEGMSIAQIFAAKGEPYFREREKQIIAEVCQEHDTVIATGGGAIVNEENATRMKASGTVICLTATPEVILQRIRKDEARPLLQGGDPQTKIRTLLSARAEAYARAGVTIDTSCLDVDEVVQAVLKVLEETEERI